MEIVSVVRKTSFFSSRPYVKGKFLYCGDHKFYIKGVTYGTFSPKEDGSQFPDASVIDMDFSDMARSGFNCVRTYTAPPKYLLDLALQYDLKVMVGLPWEQHLTFLDQRDDILKRIKDYVLSLQKHPAILCYTIGNEIPAPIVRWYGKKKIEKFLKQLYNTVKSVDAEGLVTYVNYPTTEYLDTSFVDFNCFNVYLETPEKLTTYISRLHNLTGNKPLVLAEIGLDSMRNGVDKQCEVLTWQVDTIYGKGCAGMFVFAWTDEWWRGGFEIEDWDFGLVTRNREPKPALFAVRDAMHNIPFKKPDLPFISVVVCTYNGSATIRDTMNGLAQLDYPAYEVIVVNDGSTDGVAEIVQQYNVRLITTTNKGLSSARNTGMLNAKGEIVAYIDDDAYPDEHWLQYLAYAFTTTQHGGIGGPNVAPAEDGPIAHCVANAPGGPLHVLTTDEIAEHIPGCNMAFRREALLKVNGCDHQYRVAGDDVDLCWRVQDAGYTIGFHPSAFVWHHRRNSLKAYWKQQKGYGKAEALLEAKWPQKYNGVGHLAWAGRIYGTGWTMPLKSKKEKVYHGTWGSALFQSVYQPSDGFINCLPLMPEWYLIVGLFGFIGLLGFLWTPLLWAFLPFVISIMIIIAQAIYSASKNASLPDEHNNLKNWITVVCLHIVQPIARLYGRIKFGLTPWRVRGAGFSWKHFDLRKNKMFLHWSEKWHSIEDYLSAIENNLLGQKMITKRGGDFDQWDIQTGNKLFAYVQCLLTVEEHGAGKQYVKIKNSVHYAHFSITVVLILAALSSIALYYQQWIPAGVFSLMCLTMVTKSIIERVNILNSLELALKNLPKEETSQIKVVQKAPEAPYVIDDAIGARERLLNLHLEAQLQNEEKQVKYS